MGVTGLWQILHPCARPIKLETLNRKRLAVDASIWIYQFLKAVRDKEGNALRNSHVVGFFRRICKLLFFGIKPVFVFDGGAPALKRQTVTERKRRREGRREDAIRTAGRLLAVQMQRLAEDEEQKRKDERDRGQQNEEEVVPEEGLVYVDEINMTQQERQQNRKFRKKDAYHLPDLDVSLNEMGGPNDPRVMSLEELQAYAKQFETGEDINVYDFSKIDYDSTFFMSLPASDRYNILNAARLRSRLRMGHSKEQLDSMFPDRMAFSKFQIERVRERNELTQRLMHINEGGDALFNGGGRVAGEKGREYVLVKNDGVEGGWALGVISDEGTRQETAIDLDKPAAVVKSQDDDEWEEENDFEDVPIEGLNRLPKRRKLDDDSGDQFARQRQAFYKARKAGRRRRPKPANDENSLFVAKETLDDIEDGWEEVDDDAELFGEGAHSADEEDENLTRAIAMSLENNEGGGGALEKVYPQQELSDVEDDDMLEVFQQSAVPDALPIPRGGGRAIANVVNQRAFKTAPESREVTSFGVPRLKPDESSDYDEQHDGDADDTMDLQAALKESRKTKRKVSPPPRRMPPALKPAESASDVAKQAGFSGPLPFEKLDLGSSLLGKKKMQERSEDQAGGFENPELTRQTEERKAEPLPPWFAGNLDEDIEKQKNLESEDRQRARDFNKQFQFQSKGPISLNRRRTGEVIDLDIDDDISGFEDGEVIDPEAEWPIDGSTAPEAPATAGESTKTLAMDVVEDAQKSPASESFESTHLNVDLTSMNDRTNQQIHPKVVSATQESTQERTSDVDEEDAELEWSESEDERQEARPSHTVTSEVPENVPTQRQRTESPAVEFEDVEIPDALSSPQTTATHGNGGIDMDDMNEAPPSAGLISQESVQEGLQQDDFDYFSDPEEEELLRQLTLEAEEHARFASTLNNKSQAQNIADYEKELRQLRNQQKKDRRDADEVTHIMIQECQQLLRLFGLPYITAPMEAEAQCAELVSLGLVDGIVTDDSDCFLFGGTRIYKNMFNQAKFVECYLTSDLEKEFDLTREKLIQVAHLLGSDYTEGLPGVGPVTALEILGEFQTLDEFKAWWTGVQMNTITKSDDAGKPFRKKFRRNATKLFLPPTFPDTRVDVAYLNPDVDSDPENFQWGVPDLNALRSFLMATIGWSQERTDEVLVPVIKDMNRRADEGTQSNITAFFDGGVGIGAAGTNPSGGRKEVFAPRKKIAESSKRMGSALSRMADKAKSRDGVAMEDTDVANGKRDAATRNTGGAEASTVNGARRKPNRVASIDSEDSFEAEDSDVVEPKKNTRKRPKHRK